MVMEKIKDFIAKYKVFEYILKGCGLAAVLHRSLILFCGCT